MLEEHFAYLSDRRRLEAYGRALEAVVRPGAVVLDLGAGTGILGLLACRAGAARVYAVDRGPILALAREVAADSGFADRMRPVRGHSTEVVLPERVDVVVADQMGPLGIDAGLLRAFADARERHLRPGGALVPGRLEIFAAPAEEEALHEKVRFWGERPGGFDFGAFRKVSGATPLHSPLSAKALLGDPVRILDLDLAAASPSPLDGSAKFAVGRDGALHGIALWFRAGLAPGVAITNAPGDAGRIDRYAGFLPLGDAVPVRGGDRVSLRFQAVPEGAIYSWRGAIRSGAGGAVVHEYANSTLDAEPLAPGDLLRRRPDFRPRLGRRGEALRTVLGLCDGSRAVADLRAAVAKGFPDLFRSPAEVEEFVAKVLEEGTPFPGPARDGGGP